MVLNRRSFLKAVATTAATAVLSEFSSAEQNYPQEVGGTLCVDTTEALCCFSSPPDRAYVVSRILTTGLQMAYNQRLSRYTIDGKQYWEAAAPRGFLTATSMLVTEAVFTHYGDGGTFVFIYPLGQHCIAIEAAHPITRNGAHYYKSAKLLSDGRWMLEKPTFEFKALYFNCKEVFGRTKEIGVIRVELRPGETIPKPDYFARKSICFES